VVAEGVEAHRVSPRAGAVAARRVGAQNDYVERAQQALVKVEKGLMLKRDPDFQNTQPQGEGANLPRRPAGDVWKELAAVKCPTMIVRGLRSDRYTPEIILRIEIAREVKQPWVQRASVGVFLVAGLYLAGLRLGVGLVERWNYLTDPAVADSTLFWVLLLAHVGFIIGIVRFVITWMREPEFAFDSMTPSAAGVEEVVTVPIVEEARVRAVEFQPTPVLEPVGAARVNELSSSGNGERGGTAILPADEIAPAQESPSEPAKPTSAASDDEYVFEEHMREILTDLARRLRPYVVRAAHALPAGGQKFLRLVLTTWRVWASIALVATLAALLLLVALLPGMVFQHAVALFGQPAFLK